MAGRLIRALPRWIVAGSGLLGVCGLALGWAMPPKAGADAVDGIYSMQARADAFDVDFVATGFPVVPNGQVAEVSPSSAQSSLDPTSSEGFASAPYPGDLLATLPTTVNGLGAGSLPPAPAYPFYVTSSYPTQPTSSQQVGPYVITTTSGPTSSTSDARVGLSTFAPQVISATADSSVTRDPQTGDMVAEATSDIAPFTVNGLLSVGETRASAVLTYDPSSGSGVVKQTSLEIGTITIAGVQVGLTDKGLVAAGTTLVPVNVASLSALLDSSGVTITYVPGSETPTSVTSSAVEITYQKTLPAPFLDTTVNVILGQVSATADPGATVPTTAAPTTGAAVSVPPSATSTGTGSQVGTTGSGLGSGSGPPSGSGVGAPASALAAPASPPDAVAPVPTALAGSRLLARRQPKLTLFYWILVAGAALALGSSRITQWLAFRVRLGSPSS